MRQVAAGGAARRRATEAFAGELLDSDAGYFEAGAEIHRVDGAEIVWMRGLEVLCAASVVQRITPEGIRGPLGRWLDQLERRCLERGSNRTRLYLQDEAVALEALLRARGYEARREIGLVRLLDASDAPDASGAPDASDAPDAGDALDASDAPDASHALDASHAPDASDAPDASGDAQPASGFVLRAVTTDRDWDEKLALHQRCAPGPDGYTSLPDLWTELERRKCASGYMTCYLIEVDGSVCGTVGAATWGTMLRIKNLVVDSACQRRGIGTQAVLDLARLAAQTGHAAAGCFAIDGAGSRGVYEKAGFAVVTAQMEWIKRHDGSGRPDPVAVHGSADDAGGEAEQ